MGIQAIHTLKGVVSAAVLATLVIIVACGGVDATEPGETPTPSNARAERGTLGSALQQRLEDQLAAEGRSLHESDRKSMVRVPGSRFPLTLRLVALSLTHEGRRGQRKCTHIRPLAS